MNDIKSDDIALKADWNPISRAGNNIITHVLATEKNGSVVFKASLFPKIISLIMAGLGVAGLFSAFGMYIKKGFSGSMIFVPLAVASFFLLVAYVSYSRIKKVLCDVGKRKVYIAGKEICSFAEVHAIQIISKSVSQAQGRSDYISYEVNLVKTDASRIKLLDHGRWVDIKKKAKAIATLIDCPVWDASADKEVMEVVKLSSK